MSNYRIQVGKSFDPIIKKMHKKTLEMNLVEIASESTGGGLFDIKKDYPNVGGLLFGKYVTSRSAGNFLAGYNASQGKYMGIGIPFVTFQKLAGAVHIEESCGNRLSKSQMASIVLIGEYSCSRPSDFVSPTYGEVMYQRRMSFIGWNYGKQH